PALTALLPEKRCRALVVRCERASICGRPNAAVCCVLKKNGRVKASIVASPATCRKGNACGAALGLFGTTDACAADATCAGTPSTSTTTTTVTVPGNTTSTTASATGPTPTPTTLPTSSLPAVSLTGCASSGYVAPVTVGSQTFALVVDSGSTTLGVAATACAGCARAGVSPLYSAGPDATDLAIMTSETFGDGSSWSGTVFRDGVSLA